MMAMLQNKKNLRILLVLGGLVIVSLLIPCAAAGVNHPVTYNIRQTPGYLHSDIEPYKSTYAKMLSVADMAFYYDYSHTKFYIGKNTMWAGEMVDLPIVYNVTGKTKYMNKTVELLMAMDENDPNNYRFVMIPAIAYDLIAADKGKPGNTLSAQNDTIIRDKIAIMTDTLYKECLNYRPYSYDYLSPEDDYGNYYPQIATAGLVLADYHNESLSTQPDVWEKMGTEALFVHDSVSSFQAEDGLLAAMYDTRNGKAYQDEAYTGYIDRVLYRWYNIYMNAKGHSIFDDYPAYAGTITDDVWSDLPNRYGNNWLANSQYANTGIKYTLGMMDAENRSNVRWHLNLLNNNTARNLLQSHWNSGWDTRDPVKIWWANIIHDVGDTDLYLTYYDFPNESAHPPSRLNNLAGIYNVMRSSWSDRAEWMSFIVWNTKYITQNRWGDQHDQLSIEYYSHGDLIIPDSGEVKEVQTPYQNFNEWAPYHNGILIGNATAVNWTRTTGWLKEYHGIRPNLTFRGMVKGTHKGDIIKAFPATQVDTRNITVKEGYATITSVEPIREVKQYSDLPTPLANPIKYNRTVILPMQDYFIVVDRASSAANYKYINAWHFASLTINATKRVSGPTPVNYIGNTIGSMRSDGTRIDWLGLTPFAETDYSTSANTIEWDATNPYGDNVNTTLFTSPKSHVTFERMIARVNGGYSSNDRPAEVWTPYVYFAQADSRTLYRVTAFLTKYANETARIPTELTVTGTGSAISIENTTGGYTDYIYTGRGRSTFGKFSTDADTIFIRNGTSNRYFLINGTYFVDSGVTVFSSSVRTTSTDLLEYRPEPGRFPNIRTQESADDEVPGPGTSLFRTIEGLPDDPFTDIVTQESADDAGQGLFTTFYRIFGDVWKRVLSYV
jgi:hypothetical protein